LDDITATITLEEHLQSRPTSRGFVRRNTYRATVLLPRTALQPSTCSSPSFLVLALTLKRFFSFLRPLLMTHFFVLIFLEQTSRTTQWKYRARRNSHLSRVPSPRRAAQNNSARCVIQPNRGYAPSRHMRCSQMRTCGRTRTTSSDSASDQAKGALRCAFATSSLFGVTDLLVGWGVVVG
jgi:hypothetical protein